MLINFYIKVKNLDMNHKGQSLVEFVTVIPIIVFILMAIVEFSLYWKSLNQVQDIVFNATNQMASVYVSENSTVNPAVASALSVINNMTPILGEPITLVDKSTTAEKSKRPFAVYIYQSSQTTSTTSGTKPTMVVTIDFSDPLQNGIILQITYQYKTILLGTEFPLPGGKSVIIIPKTVEIINNKTQQYNTY